MKSIIKILLLGLLSASCNDFLEESSQDEIRPSSVNDMEELLIGEGYSQLYTDYYANTTQYFTDDIECNGFYEGVMNSLVTLESNRWKFCWQQDMFDESGGGNDRMFWEMPYEKIKGCNVVLDYIDNVDGDLQKKENLRGEAYALRGFYYLLLVNYFGMPYNEGDPTKNLGVPLKLTMDVTEKLFTRNTVAEVYRSIEDDLLKGVRLMEENKVPKHYDRLNHVAAKALLSRMYLYMEQWDKALDYANQVLEIKPDLSVLSSWSDSWDPLYPSWSNAGVYSDNTPEEIIWARPFIYVMVNGGDGKDPYSVSAELINLYEMPSDENPHEDLRATVYFVQNSNYSTDEYYIDFVCKEGRSDQSGIRTAEMYLNRAEAYVHKFMDTKKEEFRVEALADLNYLRKHRYDTRKGDYVNVDIQDATELFQFYKEERRRELCGEGNHRWFDLRRWGMPELKHIYFVNPGEEQTYTLEEKSSGYVLPIPSKAFKYNPIL